MGCFLGQCTSKNFPCLAQCHDINAGLKPLCFEQEYEIFSHDIACGSWCERATTKACQRRIKAGTAGFQSSIDVREAEPARIVKVRDDRNIPAQRNDLLQQRSNL